MIRSRLVNGQAQERFKRDTVIDLAFQIRIGRDLEPFLKQQALEQQKRGIGLATFSGFAGVIEFSKQLFDRFSSRWSYSAV